MRLNLVDGNESKKIYESIILLKKHPLFFSSFFSFELLYQNKMKTTVGFRFIDFMDNGILALKSRAL